LPAIYTGTSFAVALLEILVHANRLRPPSAARFVRAIVPDDIVAERLSVDHLPGWDRLDDLSVAQDYGSDWLTERRSAVLVVPSVITGGLDTNAIVNPDHPDAARIMVEDERTLPLDPRLFGS